MISKKAKTLPRFPSALDPIPQYLTHYFERSAGPFLNICDLSDDEVQKIRDYELGSDITFSRFKIWPEFMKSRKAADDLLIRLYQKKFKKAPAHRPVFAVLGDYHQIPGLYADPGCIQIDIANLRPDEVTFMYPDHAHLIQFFDHDAPAFGVPLPENYCEETMPCWGKLFTFDELRDMHVKYGIKDRIDRMLKTPGTFVGSYVEAHLWIRNLPYTPARPSNPVKTNQPTL